MSNKTRSGRARAKSDPGEPEAFDLTGAPDPVEVEDEDEELDAAIAAVVAAAADPQPLPAAIPVPPARAAAAPPPPTPETWSNDMNTETTMRSIGADAQAEIAELRAKVEALMSERVTPAVTAVAEQAGAAMRTARDEVRGQTARVSHAVQEQPLMALGVAALAGFVVALMTRR